jgi:Delta7-sterol 5-desaturase
MYIHLLNHVVYPLFATIAMMLLATLVHFKYPPIKYDNKLIKKSIIVSFLNTYMVSILESLIQYKIISPYKVYYSISDYGIQWFIISNIIFCLSTDFLLWLMHFILHNKSIFNKVHYYHHQFTYPTAFDFASVHIIEMLLAFTISHITAVFMTTHVWTMTFWSLIMGIVPILEHGEGLVMFKKYTDPEFHNIHHKHFYCNYGVGPLTGFWDKLLGYYRIEKNEKSSD